MIKFSHSLRNEIYFTVILSFVPELMSKIALLLSGAINEVLLSASVESKVLKRKGEAIDVPLVLLMSDNESMSIDDGKLVLMLDVDAYELINNLLEGVLDGERVMPEITELYVKEWKKEKGLALVVEE